MSSAAVASASDPANLLGKVVGEHYRVIARIATGSRSAVYEVVDARNDARGAMKVLLPALGADPQIAARFVREAKAMSMFEHPNIVDLRDLGRCDDGTLFLITDLVRGVSVRDLVADGLVDQRRALSIVRQVLDALGHAHARGVIHRDVKPENIMLADGGSSDGEADFVKMVDFGVAKLLDDAMSVLGESTLTQAGCSVLGSPTYMAPEPMLGRPVDARTDLYSVGVILFELLAGKPPFVAEDDAALLRMHATAPVPSLAAVTTDRTFTPQLEYVVSDALAKKPEHRFKSAAEMIAAVDSAIRSLDPLETATPSPPAVAEAVSPKSHGSEPLQAMAGTIQPAHSEPPQSIGGPDVPAPLYPGRHDERHSRRRLREYRRFVVVASALGLVLVIAIVGALTGDGRSAESLMPSSTGARGEPAWAWAGGTGTPTDGHPGDGDHYLAQGHADLKRGRRIDALGAYERAIALAPALASDPQLRSNTVAMLDTRDSVAAVIALELLATRVKPRARDEIVARASNGKVAEIRRRAFAIAERDGFEDKVDRTESWSLDLQQATTCEDRKIAIAKLRAARDRRALAVLRRARTQFSCIEREATEAIAQLESESRP